MKVSIITAVLNGEKTIYDCVKSVARQTYSDIEHVVIDGGSSDKTLDTIAQWGITNNIIISEPDNGLYDAMNKGIKIATGDIIGILNSDDIYANEDTIKCVVNCLSENCVNTCYGDLVYVDCKDINRQVRYWKSGAFNKESFRRGWMPPHPTFFVLRHVYEKYGSFDLNFPLAADYELMLRFLYKYEITTIHIPQVLVKMRTGGRCSPGLLNTSKAIFENYKAWKINDLKPNPMTFILKPFSKLRQLNYKPKLLPS